MSIFNRVSSLLRATDGSADAADQVDIILISETNAKELMETHKCDALLVLKAGYGGLGGYIMWDSRNRFVDGTLVTTSTVTDISAASDLFTVVQTRNTRYLCIG